jgi:hypothetical protein
VSHEGKEKDAMTIDFESGTQPPPEDTSNRLFIIVAAILGVILLIAVAALLLYAFILAPQLRSSQSGQVATIDAQNTVVSMEITQTASAVQVTLQAPQATAIPAVTVTPSPVPPTPTPWIIIVTSTPSPTIAGVALLPADTPDDTLTAVAAQAFDATETAEAAMPTTGFAEREGVPGLLLLGIGLVGVAFLARQARHRRSE